MSRTLRIRLTGFVLGAILAGGATAAAAPPDSCLALHRATLNLDSVMVDTCDRASPERARWYARRGYHVRFVEYYPPLPAAPSDSVVRLSWRDIASERAELRGAFEALERRFGPFELRKTYPAITDSTHIASRLFTLAFASYVHLDSAWAAIDAIAGVDVSFPNLPGEFGRAEPVDDEIRVGPRVYPNPNRGVFTVVVPAHPGIVVELLGLDGRVHRRIDVAGAHGAMSLRIDASDLPPGHYLLRAGPHLVSVVIGG